MSEGIWVIGKMKKTELLAIVATMEKVNDVLLGREHKDLQGLAEILVQCQDAAIQIGTSLEAIGEPCEFADDFAL